MKYDAVIFDLGNTLVSYYTRSQWGEILDRCIAEVVCYLRGRELLRVDSAALPERVARERGERGDHRVMPLAERLRRIFDLSPGDLNEGEMLEMSRRFLAPIFATARRDDHALPILAGLRKRGLKTGILSNCPWGSPAQLWREEIDRHGLLDAVDAAVFCTEVGWRKPAPAPFELIAGRLGVEFGKCLFVGDDPRWDVAGPQAAGMDAVLICPPAERDAAADPDKTRDFSCPRIASLPEVLNFV